MEVNMAKKSGEHEITENARGESPNAEEFAEREVSHGTALFKDVKDDTRNDIGKADPKKVLSFLRKDQPSAW
jgi:hypothetical protein